MSISSENHRNDYVGSGATNEFDYTFRIQSSSHLAVTVVSSTGVETTLVLNTDYTVSGVGDGTGGSIVLIDAAQDWLDASGNLDTGYSLTILRNVPLTQTTDIRNQGAFYPETHEDTFDRLVMIDQQQQDEINRSLKIPTTEDPTEAAVTLPSVDDRAGNYFAWDQDGNPVAIAGAIDLDLVSVSAYMLTLLDDTSAATARVTLGIGTDDITFSTGKGPIIVSPDGLSTWRVVVDNSGNIGTEQVS